MFGLFKKKDSDKDRVKTAIRREFDETVAVARVAPLSKQARVGKGVNDALSFFDREYTKKDFQDLSFPERKVFLDVLAADKKSFASRTETNLSSILDIHSCHDG
ncbi:hypothetical protein [Paracoccus sediminicola]|uniref:hypothetical protein n=1 Tax=Paracoccus sediminicola TaxID=3017783 RepID=UPI0022F08F34|nr:hypothetical protein [Paracoccus sediminicola]WBU58057.1 hypothetical protein PAF18_06440 [Paracoccus sediminicola]